MIQEEITSPRLHQQLHAQSIPLSHPSQHMSDLSHVEQQVISELQADKRVLNLENDDLRTQLKQMTQTVATKDKLIDNLQYKQNELISHIKTLQLERSALMNTVTRLQVLMNTGDCVDTGRKRLMSSGGKETIAIIDNARIQLDREVSLLMNTMQMSISNSSNGDNNNMIT